MARKKKEQQVEVASTETVEEIVTQKEQFNDKMETPIELVENVDLKSTKEVKPSVKSVYKRKLRRL